MIGMRERVRQDEIRAEWVSIDPPAWAGDDDWDKDARWYEVTLRMGGRRLTTPFGMGSTLWGDPTAEDVLNCLVSDSAGVENAQGFEDWCAEYGYDADSRRAERTYRQCQRQAAGLRRFLGEKYEAYLWETEPL